MTSRRPIGHKEVGDGDTGPFAVLFPLIRRGVFAFESQDLAEFLGRAPTNIGGVVNGLVGRTVGLRPGRPDSIPEERKLGDTGSIVSQRTIRSLQHPLTVSP